MFNPHDKNKTIDIETSGGLKMFEDAAAKQALFKKGRGLGDMSTAKLFDRLVNALKYPSFGKNEEGESAEIFLYDGCQVDAVFVEKAATVAREDEKRGQGDQPIYRIDDAALAVLEKLRGWRNPYAVELLNRLECDPDGKSKASPGRYDDGRAREYWLTLARDAKAAGFAQYARHFERIARHPAAGELLAPERTVLKKDAHSRRGAPPKKMRKDTLELAEFHDSFLRFMAKNPALDRIESIHLIANQQNSTYRAVAAKLRRAEVKLGIQTKGHAK